MWKIYVCLVCFAHFTMLKMVCVLIVQLLIHVMNGAPEQTIDRKSEGDNKSERKRWRSMAVIMSMSWVTMEVSGCDDDAACNWRQRWIKLTLIVGSHDRRSLQLYPKMYYYASPTPRSKTKLPLKKQKQKQQQQQKKIKNRAERLHTSATFWNV